MTFWYHRHDHGTTSTRSVRTFTLRRRTMTSMARGARIGGATSIWTRRIHLPPVIWCVRSGFSATYCRFLTFSGLSNPLCIDTDTLSHLPPPTTYPPHLSHAMFPLPRCRRRSLVLIIYRFCDAIMALSPSFRPSLLSPRFLGFLLLNLK